MAEDFSRFDGVATVRDVEALRALAVGAVAFARQLAEERDAALAKLAALEDDLVAIPVMSVQEMADLHSAGGIRK
jgi:hypothetical protein